MSSKQDLVLGIDIGGTNTAFGFVNESGDIIREGTIPTNAHEPANIFFNRLFPAIAKLQSEMNGSANLRGIGIGAPNANYYRGTVEQPPNLNWGTVNVVELFTNEFHVPAVITNDANAAAIGEMKFGAAKGMNDFIVITLGTGLGSGIVVGGNLVYGHDGFAGEIGHVNVVPGGRDCGCGRKGCLETYASATGIRRTVSELLSERLAPSKLRDIPFTELTSKKIYQLALEGDAIAIEAFIRTGDILGKALADAIVYTSPEAIILFGGLALSGDLIVAPTKESLDRNVLNIFRNKTKIVLSELCDKNAAVLGSAALIWSELEKNTKAEVLC
jgi:glucokinase